MKSLKSLSILLAASIFSACTTMAVDRFDVAHHEVRSGDQLVPGEQIPGVTYKVVEMTKINAFAPGYAYHVLYRCNDLGENCMEVAQQPVTFPGIAPSMINATVQGAAVGYAGHEIGNGIAQSGSQTTITGGNASASATGGSSVSGSSSTSGIVTVGSHGR